MASPPSRTDLAGTPTVATYKLAIGGLYDYVASLLGNGTATIASETEKKLARENLGIGNFGFKNRFINPEFMLSQEFGSSSTAVPINTYKCVVDQWYVVATGAAISAQRIAGIGTQKYSLRITGASGNTGARFLQPIEAASCYDFKNQDVVISFNSKVSTDKTVTWVASYANSENNFGSVTQIATGTINVTTSINAYNFSFNAGANAPNGLLIDFSVASLGIAETIDYDSMQIEKSNVATEFEVRNVGFETLLCQRYYEDGIIGFNGGYQSAGSSFTPYANFRVSKFATPTMTITTTSSSNANAIAIQPQSANSFRYGANAIATGVVVLVATYTAKARLL